MNGRPLLPHECGRSLSVAITGSWDESTTCTTCDTLDTVWRNGYDSGKESGRHLGRYDAQRERKLPPLAQAVVCLLIVMALVDFIVSHRPEGTTE